MSESQTGHPDHGGILALVYDELRDLAAHHLRGERSGHTLEPTALVHEVYLRLHGRPELVLGSRTHFLALASRAMRNVLVDHARARLALKRGGGATHVTVGEGNAITEDRTADVLAVDQALGRLAEHDERLARIVEMRFFAGMTDVEIAQVLGVTDRTVRNQWSFARVWLRRELEGH